MKNNVPYFGAYKLLQDIISKVLLEKYLSSRLLVPGKVCFLVWLFFLKWSLLSAQAPIRIINSDEVVPLTGHVAIFRDLDNNTTIEQIISGQNEVAFQATPMKSLNFGHLPHPLWIRFVVLKNIDDNIYLSTGNPNLDSLMLYGTEGDHISVQWASFNQRMEEREIFSNDQILLLSQAINTEKTWYIRLSSNITPIQFSGKITTLKTLAKEQTVSNLIFGMYVGSIVLVCTISLFWYLLFRDLTYLYYIGYNVFFLNTVLIITGYYSLIYPSIMIPSMNVYFTFENLLWLIFITAFSTRFLEVKKYAPEWMLGIRTIYALHAILFVFVLLNFNILVYQIFEIFSLLVSAYLIGAAIICLHRGYWVAKYYLFGFGALILSGSIVIFTNFGIISFIDSGYHGLKAGHTIEIMFFLFGMVQRTALINREKERHIQEHNEIEMLFGQQVSKEIMQHLLVNKGELPSRRMDVSILFMDIRNFTPFSEAHSPEEVIHFQNTVFNEFINIIEAQEGIVVTLLGDGLFAAFGTPVYKSDHASQAVRAGLQMMEAVRDLSDRKLIAPTRIGVGIHSGLVVAGNIGNDIRKEFSLSGVTVIIASRVEQLNKELGTECLITKDVLNRIDPKEFQLNPIGQVTLKGIENPVEVFSINYNAQQKSTNGKIENVEPYPQIK